MKKTLPSLSLLPQTAVMQAANRSRIDKMPAHASCGMK